MTQKELEAKFGSLARRVISDKQVMKIIDIINCLEELSDVRELAPTFCQTRMGKPEI
jgi:hypothetical protein